MKHKIVGGAVGLTETIGNGQAGQPLGLGRSENAWYSVPSPKRASGTSPEGAVRTSRPAPRAFLGDKTSTRSDVRVPLIAVLR